MKRATKRGGGWEKQRRRRRSVNPLEHPHTRVTGEMLVRRDVAHATATPLPGFFYAATVVFVFVAVHGLSENC